MKSSAAVQLIVVLIAVLEFPFTDSLRFAVDELIGVLEDCVSVQVIVVLKFLLVESLRCAVGWWSVLVWSLEVEWMCSGGRGTKPPPCVRARERGRSENRAEGGIHSGVFRPQP